MVYIYHLYLIQWGDCRVGSLMIILLALRDRGCYLSRKVTTSGKSQTNLRQTTSLGGGVDAINSLNKYMLVQYHRMAEYGLYGLLAVYKLTNQ